MSGEERAPSPEYREWVGRLKPTLRQVHTAGERIFVDFAGHAMEVIDGATGEVRRAEIFVAVLGASSYTFAEATWTQSLPDWIAAHVAMLAFIGGAPRQIVSDNLRAGITRACFYEPLVNRTYADMASHYGTAVVPARPYKPRDKAKVEVGVQVVQRWILARLRNRQFFSLAELNQAIRELVDQLNDRPMRGWGATRRALYEQVDRPALRELPPAAYEYADWKRCRVNLDYHVEIDKHFYSVPFRLLREEVEARITAKTVEIFHHGKLVAAHLRSLRPYRPTTLGVSTFKIRQQTGHASDAMLSRYVRDGELFLGNAAGFLLLPFLLADEEMRRLPWLDGEQGMAGEPAPRRNVKNISGAVCRHVEDLSRLHDLHGAVHHQEQLAAFGVSGVQAPVRRDRRCRRGPAHGPRPRRI